MKTRGGGFTGIGCTAAPASLAKMSVARWHKAPGTRNSPGASATALLLAVSFPPAPGASTPALPP